MTDRLKIYALAISLAAASAAQAQASKYSEIALDDLKLDVKQMIGKRVAVKAQIQTMGEISMLKSDPVDMTPVYASTDSLPREDRRKLVNGCQMIVCGGKFFGVIQKGVLGPTVALEKVEW